MWIGFSAGNMHCLTIFERNCWWPIPPIWPDVKVRACSLLHLARCEGMFQKRQSGASYKSKRLKGWCSGFKGKMRLGRWRKWQLVVHKGKWEVGTELRDKREKDSVWKLFLLLKRNSGNLLWYWLRRAERWPQAYLGQQCQKCFVNCLSSAWL